MYIMHNFANLRYLLHKDRNTPFPELRKRFSGASSTQSK